MPETKMKALILAGGSGTRLRPLTHTSAKQLIPVANKATIQYGIESIVEAGITDIGIIVGESKDTIREALGNGSQFGANFTYIEQESPLGLAHAVQIAEDFIASSSFLMYLGDNIIDGSLEELVTRFQREKPDALILVNEMKHPEQYGVVELRNGVVHRLIEKPIHPPSNLALVGVYLFSSAIFSAVQNIRVSKRNELEITDAIQWMVDQNYWVLPHVIDRWWKDTGKPEDLLDANRFVLQTLESSIEGTVCSSSILQGNISIAEGATILNSIIEGPSIIGANSIIKNARIGAFTSIGANVLIEEANIEGSIVLEDSSICNYQGRIIDSLIGKGVSISSTSSDTQSFVLGDRSHIRL